MRCFRNGTAAGVLSLLAQVKKKLQELTARQSKRRITAHDHNVTFIRRDAVDSTTSLDDFYGQPFVEVRIDPADPSSLRFLTYSLL